MALDRTLDLIGTEASGTSVHMAGSTVNDSLDALDVGLPCTVGTSVGVGNLDTEGHALAAKITLSHFIAPPIWIIIIVRLSQALRYDTRLFLKMQALFYKFFSFFQKSSKHLDIPPPPRYNNGRNTKEVAYMVDTYSVALSDLVKEFDLEVEFASTDFDSIRLTVEDVSRPGIQLAGYFDHFDPMRLQVLGNVEMSYLEKQSPC